MSVEVDGVNKSIKVDTVSEATSANGVAIDGLTIKDGGITATTGAIVFNEASADLDFRVESNGTTHMLFVDGGNDCVNIGASSDRGGLLNVEGNGGVVIRVADNNDALKLQSTDTDANAGPLLTLERTNNSAADSDDIGKIILKAQNDANQAVEYGIIRGDITDASDGTEDGVIKVETLVAGTNREIARFGDGVGVVFNEDSNNLDFRVESDQSDKAFFVNGEYGHCHITGASSATKVAYYSGGLGALQLGLGGFILSYDYNVIDGPYILHNEWFDGSTTKYVADGEAARFGAYDGRFIFYTANSGSANASVSMSHRFEIANNGDLTATDTSIGSNSDQRLKENIQDFTYDVSKFKSFKTRTFDWKNPEAHTHEATTGFLAQEVESVDSDWAYEIPWDDSKLNNEPKKDEEKALCGGEAKKASKLGKKDAMYVSVIQQLITRIEALEDA